MDLDYSILDHVLKKTIVAVETSKGQIFDFAEGARQEHHGLKLELEKIKREVAIMIDQTDELEKSFRASRQRLVEVSRDFRKYTEGDIKAAYERASQIQVDLSVLREKEAHLRKSRDDLERRIRQLNVTIDKADNMMTQIGVVLGFLTGDLGEFAAALESAQHRQLFGLQVIQGQEEERKRVARDIHDGPAQSMANLMIRTEIAEKMIDQGRVLEAKQELAELKETARNTLGEVRKIIFDLRPMALDDLGLIPTLRKYVENNVNLDCLEVDLQTIGNEVRLEPIVEVVIFRMIQEALNNVRKHAKAKQVQIKMEYLPKKVVVVVRDNGIGFTERDTPDRPHFGIMGMKERMKLINGTMELHSVKNEGTRLQFTIPISQK